MYSLWFQGYDKLLGTNLKLKNLTNLIIFICTFYVFFFSFLSLSLSFFLSFIFFLYKMPPWDQDFGDTTQ